MNGKKWVAIGLSVVVAVGLVFGLFFAFTNEEDPHTENPNEISLNLTSFFDDDMQEDGVEFSNSIMNFTDFERIIPLGNVSMPGHPIPTDHIYFVIKNVGSAVFAPAGGKVLYIGGPSDYGDYDIRVAVPNTMTYYLGHILIANGLSVGDNVVAEQQSAISRNTACVDFGLINKNASNRFIYNKYPVTTVYAEKPLFYYAEPLRSQLYAKVMPADEPDYDGGVTDGKLVYDIAGTLSGNWIKETDYNTDSWYEYTALLAFVYDVFYTDQIRIPVGVNSNFYALKNEDAPILPENVTTDSGIITYYLYNANNTSHGLPTEERMALMIVQMITDTKLKLEIFEATTSTTREFTSSAIYYVR